MPKTPVSVSALNTVSQPLLVRCQFAATYLIWLSAMGEYTRTGDGVPNLFGLTQFDGKTQFFDGDICALPQVSLIDRVECKSNIRQSKQSYIALGCKQV